MITQHARSVCISGHSLSGRLDDTIRNILVVSVPSRRRSIILPVSETIEYISTPHDIQTICIQMQVYLLFLALILLRWMRHYRSQSDVIFWVNILRYCIHLCVWGGSARAQVYTSVYNLYDTAVYSDDGTPAFHSSFDMKTSNLFVVITTVFLLHIK